MDYTTALAMFIFIAMVTGRPATEENTGSRDNGQNAESDNTNSIFTTPWQSNMNLNSNDISEYLRCVACMTECANVRQPLSYYLCRNCLESCANRTDAFMHFFSSHQCKVMPQPVTGRGFPPNEVMGGILLGEDATATQHVTSPSPVDSENTQVGQNRGLNQRKDANQDYDYLDEYMTKRFFNKKADNCAVRQQQYDILHSKYAQCLTDLGNCNSNWPTISGNDMYGNGQIDYPTYDADYPDESTDKERSAMPPTSHPLIDPGQAGNNDTTAGSVQTIHPRIKSANMRIIKQFKSMFVTKDEYDKLSKESWTKKPKQLANIKSMGNNNDDREPRQEEKTAVCPTRFKVHSPMKVEHRSGDFFVELLRDDEYVQPFIVAECSSKKPSIGIIDRAECSTVSVQRNAVMIIPAEKGHMFENCMEYDEGRLACRDWISLPGACSLFF